MATPVPAVLYFRVNFLIIFATSFPILTVFDNKEMFARPELSSTSYRWPELKSYETGGAPSVSASVRMAKKTLMSRTFMKWLFQ